MESSSLQRPGLPLHEWLIIALFCLILLSLATLSWSRSPKAFSSSQEAPSKGHPACLTIYVTGEVQHPGRYTLPAGATFKELLAQIELKESADITQLSRRRKIKEGETIEVKPRRAMTIEVLGAVKRPGTYEILSGTRCFELVQKLEFLPEADTRELMKKQRFVREGERFYIATRGPQKTKRKKGL